MRRSVFLAVCFAALAAIVASASKAEAAPGGTVSWGAGSPAAAKGTVTGSGTWTAAQGFAPVGTATLFAVPTGGGQFLTAAGAINANGTWGPATINNVPAGQYTVYAVINFKDPITMVISTVSSPTAILNVP